MTNGAGRLPDFLVIGAMKAGTTTLWEHLSRHPRVLMSRPKEPQYFSREHVRARGLDWYRGLWADARPDQLCGEASACYARWPEFDGVPERIAALIPGAKLVYVVRHPVERTYSHYGHEMEERELLGTGPRISLERALDEVPNLIDASLYDVQLTRYLAAFPRSALHVMLLEDWRRDAGSEWGKLQDFIGLPHVPLDRSASERSNAAGDRIARVTARRALRQARSSPLFNAVRRWVPKSLRAAGRSFVSQPALARWLTREKVAAHKQRLSPLEPATRARLLERFEPSTSALEQLLGRDLSEWRR